MPFVSRRSWCPTLGRWASFRSYLPGRRWPLLETTIAQLPPSGFFAILQNTSFFLLSSRHGYSGAASRRQLFVSVPSTIFASIRRTSNFGYFYLNKGNFSGIRIPLYRFGSNSVLYNDSVGGISYLIEEEQSVLDSILLAQWEDRMWKGLFRYDVTTSEIKVIGGRRKFIAQFNEGWSRDYMPKLGKNKIRHQEDVFEFSWMERQEELLFCVATGEKFNPELVLSAAVPDCALLITINSSPVEYGRVFLVPHSSNILHQFLDARSLELVLCVAVEVNNCSFCLFYDYSPSASHKYFQACYLQIPLPVEFMPLDTFFGDGQEGIRIFSVTDYPIKTLVFESNHLKMMMEVLVEICSCLQEKLIPYNLLISDHGKRIFLFFQHRHQKTFVPFQLGNAGDTSWLNQGLNLIKPLSRLW